MEQEYWEGSATEEELKWANRYNAYNRLAQSPEHLALVLEPVLREYRASGRVPDWCGVDLLKAWAFYLFRSDYFAGGGTLGREWKSVLQAVRDHPSARVRDRPPLPGEASRD